MSRFLNKLTLEMFFLILVFSKNNVHWLHVLYFAYNTKLYI